MTESVKNNTTPLIYQAMAGILADIDCIGKTRTANMGGAGNYSFRGIDDMYNVIHGSFAKYGVFLLPKVLEQKIEIIEKEKTYNGVTTKTYTCSAVLTIEYTFMAADGSSVSAVGIGQAFDQSDKAVNKAQSAALKYCLMQAFLIPTEESKDVENDNIQAEATKSTPIDNLADKKASLRKAFDILNWDASRKGEWVKAVSEVPIGKWGKAEYEVADKRAWSEVHKANSQEVAT
jgi:hypothetical protein